MSKDLLTKEERAVVDEALGKYGALSWEQTSEHIEALVKLVDRLAPKPREFSWAPGYDDFAIAHHETFSGNATHLDVFFALKQSGMYAESTLRVLGAMSLKLAQAGMVNIMDRRVVVTDKGRAWLADYEDWKKEHG